MAEPPVRSATVGLSSQKLPGSAMPLASLAREVLFANDGSGAMSMSRKCLKSYYPLATAVALALMLTGCGADESDGRSSADPAAVSPTSDVSTADETGLSQESEAETGSTLGDDSPAVTANETLVEDALSWAGLRPWSSETWTEYRTGVELAVAQQQDFIYECMTQQGWEYFRRSSAGIVWVPLYSLPADSKAWVERYGIGLSTTYFLQEQIGGAGAVGHVGDRQTVPDLGEDSDEARYLSSLDPAAFSEYQTALVGVDPSQVQFVDGEYVLPPGANLADSCEGRAREMFPEPFRPTPEAAALGERVLSSARWIDGQTSAWACVERAGYPAATTDQLSDLLIAEFEEVGLFDSRFDDVGRADSLPQEFVEVLAVAQAIEVEAALVLWECGAHAIQDASAFAEIASELVGGDG